LKKGGFFGSSKVSQLKLLLTPNAPALSRVLPLSPCGLRGRTAKESENFLNYVDQLSAVNRSGRDYDYGYLPDQSLLQITKRFPVHHTSAKLM